VVNAMSLPFYTLQNDPVPTVQEAGWTPGLVWKGAENLATLGFDHWTLKLLTNLALLK